MPAWFKVVAVFRLSIGRISTTIVHLNDLEEIFFHRQRCECTMVIIGYHAHRFSQIIWYETETEGSTVFLWCKNGIVITVRVCD